ncbi:MFS transporter [Pontiellaceae bacterium B12227]|nr:MFS transporter [Pontiellaceae bacterium B12227]
MKNRPIASSSNSSLPRYQKLAWGAGGLTNDLINAIGVLAIPIYAIAMGVNPAWIGLALAVPRIWDAFTDPLMGHISDNFRSRWGRRRPLILLGSVLLGITFPLLWLPSPAWGPALKTAWFLIMLIAFYTAFTIWSVPWNALGFELTSDYNERTRVQAWRAAIATLAGWIVPWAYKLCFIFNKDEIIGARYVGLLIGLILASTGILSALFCKEQDRAQKQEKIKLGPAFACTLKNKPFQLICAGVALFIAGVFLVQPMALYVNIYHVFDGSREAASTISGMGGMSGAIMALLAVPLISFIATRWGKKKTLILGMAIAAAGYLSQGFTYNPANPYLEIISFCTIAPGVAFIWIILPSMLADICDVDELQTGLRREGMYGAVYGWLLKIGVTIGLSLSGFVLTIAGIVPSQEIQSPEAIRTLRILFSLVPFTFTLAAALLMARYPLTEERVNELKQQLQNKHDAETTI